MPTRTGLLSVGMVDAWSQAAQYLPGAQVTHGGSTYTAQRKTVGVEPPAWPWEAASSGAATPTLMIGVSVLGQGTGQGNGGDLMVPFTNIAVGARGIEGSTASGIPQTMGSTPGNSYFLLRLTPPVFPGTLKLLYAQLEASNMDGTEKCVAVTDAEVQLASHTVYEVVWDGGMAERIGTDLSIGTQFHPNDVLRTAAGGQFLYNGYALFDYTAP